jgi:hypothetical protein
MRVHLTAIVVLVLAGCGQKQEPVEALVDPPQAPDSLNARPLGVRGVEIGWRDRTGGTAWFEIERETPGGWIRVGMRPPGQSVWEEWGLEPDRAYRYRVRALDNLGQASASMPVEVVTPPSVVPAPRVEVFDRRAVSPGATLFNVEDYHDVTQVAVVMAVDEEGAVLWHIEHQGQFVTETDVYPGGDVLAQTGPTVSRLDRKGDLVDYYDGLFVHHDVDVLPWGNLIAITSEETEQKRKIEDLYSKDRIMEIDGITGEVVHKIWFDRMVPAREICRACITTQVVGGADWIHVNALDYDLGDEALYVSVRNLDRIYKLSYPEGEIEWVMGDGGDFGEGLFTHQHNPVRLGPGRMLVFDNGLHPDPFEEDRSRVIEIEYDPDARLARIVWQYDGPPPFYSEAQGDASRLANGNTLVVDSAGPRIVEVAPDGMVVWELTLPKPYVIYKAHRIENFL